MVRLPARDRPGAVQLLGKDQPRQLVRECERGQLDRSRRSRPYGGRKSVRTPDDEAEVARVLTRRRDETRELRRGEAVAVLVAGEEQRAGRQALEQPLALALTSLVGRYAASRRLAYL